MGEMDPAIVLQAEVLGRPLIRPRTPGADGLSSLDHPTYGYFLVIEASGKQFKTIMGGIEFLTKISKSREGDSFQFQLDSISYVKMKQLLHQI